MTEAEWLACDDPEPMLRWLGGELLASQRKLRLFACGCCRLIWDQIEDDRCKGGVRAAERYADGEETWGHLAALVGWADRVVAPPQWGTPAAVVQSVAHLVMWVGLDRPTAAGCAEVVRDLARGVAGRRAQAAMAREVFGNPLRKVRRVSAATQAKVAALPPGRRPRDLLLVRDWLQWQDGTVPRLAQGIYEGRRFEDMPVLHDALLDAGCDNPDILDHGKAPGIHVRGCWVLDLLLGKE